MSTTFLPFPHSLRRRAGRVKTTAAAALLAFLLGSPQAAAADSVIDWNNVTLDAIRATSTPPPPATRALAMVHIAIFDAVNGIQRGYTPYLVKTRAPRGASAAAAAAAAAHHVLSRLFPALAGSFDLALLETVASLPNQEGILKGLRWGEKCGRTVMRQRARDRAGMVVDYQPSGEFGYWQPTPPAFAPALLPQWPFVEPFTMRSGSQFRVPAPPPFTSAEYAAAYNEVKDYGGSVSSVRTPDQFVIAHFWEDGAGTVTPPGHWQIIAQQFAELFGNSLLENARLFALLSMAQADAAIVSWDNKYFHDHVRPYTGITEEADLDGNPATTADPTWFNLIPTPPFPTYTSGHSTFSGSSSVILARFFGSDDLPFCGDSPDPQRWPDVLPGVTRCWDSLSEAAEEAGQSRVYGGIHWQYDNQEGLNSGRALANFVFDHFLLPRN